MKKRELSLNLNFESITKFVRLPRSKNSQVTIFIILAIVILVVIIAFFYLKSSFNKEEQDKDYFILRGIKPSIKNIQDFNLECLKENSLKALETIGIQGGFYKKPEKYYDLEWAFVPYYYYNGEILFPSKDKIQNELSQYIDDNLPICIDELNENFKTFKITYSKPLTKTVILGNKVTFTTNLDLTIDNDGKTTLFSLNKHPIEIESSLNDIHKMAEYITESHKEDPNFICINCIAQLSKEKNVYVDFIEFEPDSTIVMIIENQTQSEPYLFQFLNKYSTANELIIEYNLNKLLKNN